MGKGRSSWQDGRRAWERLNGWHQDAPEAVPGHADDGDKALGALTDVGSVRRLLDQAELVAVRTARRHRKSWAEIATHLGVSRQSAWERWRDLDEVTAEGPDEEARARRRRSSVVVPDVIGMTWEDARLVLIGEGLVAVGADPDAPPVAIWSRSTVVTDQSPESGANVPAGSPVRLWVDRGGGSGVREPRNPKPNPREGREVRYEQSDEARS